VFNIGIISYEQIGDIRVVAYKCYKDSLLVDYAYEKIIYDNLSLSPDFPLIYRFIEHFKLLDA